MELVEKRTEKIVWWKEEENMVQVSDPEFWSELEINLNFFQKLTSLFLLSLPFFFFFSNSSLPFSKCNIWL